MDKEKLNKLSEQVKHVANLGVEKSSALLELSRLSIETKSLEKDLKTAYLELGELFYKDSKNRKNLSGDYLNYSKNIEEIESKLQHLSKKILKIKDMKLCKYCNKEMLKSSVFCPSCGNRVN